MKYLIILTACTVLLFARNEYYDQTWGIGLVGRMASIPYNDPVLQDNTLDDMTFLMYFENKYFYLHEMTYGLKLYDTYNIQFSAISRIRLLNVSESYQNEIQGSNLDYGLRGRYFLYDNQYIDLEVMTNGDSSNHANLTYSANLIYDDAYFEPYATFRIKNATFNTEQYGLDKEDIRSDIDLTIGMNIKYHIWSNFYFLGSASFGLLGGSVRDSKSIDEDYTYDFTAGIGILNDKNRDFFEIDGMKQYIRIANGWATTSNLSEILSGQIKSDTFNNTMTSILYGLPLSKTLFTLPLEVYITPGMVFHHHSQSQDSTQEFVLGLKFYYTLPLSDIDIRFGAASGLSYVIDIPYIEQIEMDEKGYESSNTMLYLDLSADFNLGFINNNLNDFWLGAAVHHRSSIFEKASLFGRIKGGSNYNTIYLQWHF